MTAYELVLQALDLFYRMDYDLFSKARGLLEQAISHDPNYALAYSSVGLWYVFRIGEIGSPDPDGDAVAGARYATQGVERGGDDAFALAVYAHAQSFLLHDLKREGKSPIAPLPPARARQWPGPWRAPPRAFWATVPTAVRQGEQGVRLSPLDARSFWHEGLLAQAHYVTATMTRRWSGSAARSAATSSFVSITACSSPRSQLRAAARKRPRRRGASCSFSQTSRFRPTAERCPFAALPWRRGLATCDRQVFRSDGGCRPEFFK